MMGNLSNLYKDPCSNTGKTNQTIGDEGGRRIFNFYHICGSDRIASLLTRKNMFLAKMGGTRHSIIYGLHIQVSGKHPPVPFEDQRQLPLSVAFSWDIIAYRRVLFKSKNRRHHHGLGWWTTVDFGRFWRYQRYRSYRCGIRSQTSSKEYFQHLHSQKLTAGYPKWWFGKGNSLQKWQLLVSMLDFWGVYTEISNQPHEHWPQLVPTSHLLVVYSAKLDLPGNQWYFALASQVFGQKWLGLGGSWFVLFL